MAITGIVVDKDGNVLSDEDLKNKQIEIQEYYDIVLPSRKRINEELSQQRKFVEKNSWNLYRFML